MDTICLVSSEVLMTRSFILKLIAVFRGVPSIATSFQARAGVGLELTVEVLLLLIKFS